MTADTAEADNRQTRQFVGKATAAISHELSNAVGTLSQLVGLLDDLVRDTAAGKPASVERLATVHERLARQASRATELSRQLNYFAHTLDGHKTDVDLNALARNLVTIAQRRAAMQRVELELHETAEPLIVAVDPHDLMLPLFLTLECLCEGREGVRIDIEVADTPARIELRSAADRAGSAPRDDRIAAISALAARRGWQLTRAAGGPGETLSLVL